MKSLAILLCLLCSSAYSQILVFNPGEGVSTNVEETISSDYAGLEIQSGSVNLLSRWNSFSGPVVIGDGASLGAQTLNLQGFSSLGVATEKITLGKASSFKYLGSQKGELASKIEIAAGDNVERAVIDTAGDLTVTGGMVTVSGSLIKTGEGKLTVATPDYAAGTVNTYAGNVASGRELEVAQGTLEFVAPSSVTNMLGDALATATDSVVIGSAGKIARLDIKGGRTLCRSKYLLVKDNAQSASINIYGGSLENVDGNATLVIGERDHSDDIAQGGASLNLFGGNVKYQYIQLASSRGGKAKLLVAGGTLSGYGLYVAHAYGTPTAGNTRVSEAEIHICTNGVIDTSMQQLARDSATKILYKVTDGGTLNLSQPLNAKYACDCSLVLDGGNVNFNGSSENTTNTIPFFVTTKIGAKQNNVFLKNHCEYRFAGPVVSALEGGVDGGIRFYGATGARIAFSQGATHTGATHFDGEVSLLLRGDLSLAKLTAPNNRLKIIYSCLDNEMPMLNLGAVEANSYFSLEFSGALPNQVCDVVSFPASAALDETSFLARGIPADKKAVFTIRESGNRKIVSVCFVSRTLETYSFQSANGGDFMAQGSWSKPVQSSQDSYLKFAQNSAAEDTVVNLAVPFVAASIDFTASPGYKLTGEKITLDNAGSVAAVSSGAGKNEIANDLKFNGVALFKAYPSSAELKVSGSIEATSVEVGDIASPLNPSYDAGVVSFDACSSYTGDFTVNSGKACVKSVANKFEPSAAGAGENIFIKFGTFEFDGGEGETNRDIILDPDDKVFSPAVSVAENSTLTLNGSILTLRGGFHKTGKGILKLGGDYYSFGENAAIIGSYAEKYYSASYLPSSYSPMRTFASMIVGAGTMVWGKDGQVVEFPHDLQIGGRTTVAANKETHAKLVINGGTTVTRTLSLGYDHGSAATAEFAILTNSLIVNGGVLNITNRFAIGTQSIADCTQHSEFVLNGGVVNCSKYTAFGFGSNPSTPSTVRVVVNGGEFNILDGDFYIGPRANCPKVEVELNGGILNSMDIVGLRFSSPPAGGGAHTVSLNEGGVLRVKHGLTCTPSAYDAQCCLVFNGGVYQPSGTYGAITSPYLIKVSDQPAKIDTSYMLRGSIVSVLGTWRKFGYGIDGGILVTGSAAQDCAVLLDSKFDCALEGAIVAGVGGVILSRKNILAGKNVQVRQGGSFGGVSEGSSAVELKVKSLTLEDGAGISVVSHSATVTSFVSATEALAQKGEVKVSLIDFNKNYSIWLAPSVFTVLRGPKGTLDATKFRLSDHYASTSEAEFTLNDSNSNYDEVVVELKSAFAAALRDETNAHTWIAEGSGNFDDINNWDTPPQNQTTDEIIFPAELHTAQIALGDTRKFGKLTSNASGEIVISGGEIDMGEGLFVDPVISSRSGTLRLPSVKTENNLTFITTSSATQIVEGVVSAKKLCVSPFLHGGALCIAGRMEVPDVTVYSGRLEAASPESLATSQINLDNASLSFASPGESDANISVHKNAKGVIDVRSGEVYSLKPLKCSAETSTTTVFKRGAGTMVFADGETSYWGGSNVKNDADEEPWAFAENGDAPIGSFGSLDVAAGKLVVGVNPKQTIYTSGFAIIGSQIADFDENGDVIDSELEVRGGVLKIGSAGKSDFYIGRNAGVYRLKKGFASRRRNLTYSQYGGEVYCGTFYMSHDSKNSCYNGKATFNLYGGRFTSAGGYIMLSAHKNSQGAQYGTSLSEINIYGGVFTNTYFKSDSLVANAGGLETTPIGSCDFNLNLYGGDFAWTSAIVIAPGANTKCRINFAGGRFITKFLKRWNDNGEVVLFWNGGVFHPTLDEVTLLGGFGANEVGRVYTGNIVSTNGAIFEVAADRKFIVDQGFTSDPELETRDGGVALRGEGELHLATQNSFTGPLRALGGTILCDNDYVIPEGVALELSGGKINLNDHPAIVGDVYGSGGEVFGAQLSVEGTLRVIGESGNSLVLNDAVFGVLSKFAPRYSYDEESGRWSGDMLRLGNASGRIIVDLGRTLETTLEKGFSLKVAEIDAASNAKLRFAAINFGNEKRLLAQFNRVVRDDGVVEVYVEIVRKRFAMIVR